MSSSCANSTSGCASKTRSSPPAFAAPLRSLGALLLAGLLCVVAPFAGDALARDEARYTLPEISYGALPREAQQVLHAIARGGPFAYRRDGVVFRNYERRLPVRGHGYYREYTVPTPGLADRGARRIIAGAPAEYYYTDDHYRSFRRIRE